MPSLASRVAAPTFGLLMVALATVGSDDPALLLAGSAVLAVAAGIVTRLGTTIAVLLSVVVIVAADPPPVLAALSGLCAVAYLVSRHSAQSWTTVVAAVGFAFVGLVATSFPLQVPWLPLAAPLGVLAIYVVSTRPFVN